MGVRKMNKQKKVFTWVLSLLLMLPLFLGLGSAVYAVEEGDTETEQTVTLHKLAFDTLPESIQNTGDEMTWPNSTPLSGAGFTAYDVTSIYWAAYDGASGTHEERVTEATDAAIAADTTGLASHEFALTDSSGISSLALPTQSGGRNAVYLFKETTTPAGAIAEKSVPFVVGLPVTDEGGNNRPVVHLYPKNEYKTSDLTFKKYGVGLDAEGNQANPVALKDAGFILKDQASGMYYQASTGKFDGTVDAATILFSDASGQVTVEDLILADGGIYEFYEVDTPVATSQLQTGAEIYHYLNNPVVAAFATRNASDGSMAIKYSHYNELQVLLTDKENASAYNYKVPEPKKEADDVDVDVDQIVTFTITQQIPKDVAQFTKFDLVDTYHSSLELVSTADEILSSIKIDGAATGDVTATIADITANPFIVSFTPAELANHAGKILTFEIQMKIKPGAPLATAIDNQIKFDNNFIPKTAQEEVKTFGKKFVKKDADTKQTLAGAEFVVKRGEAFLKMTDGKVSWVATQGDATVFQSNDQGVIEVFGIAKTDELGADIVYQLVEIKAPDGYVLPNTPTNFVADNGKVELVVVNKTKGKLPITGGMGITVFLAAGLTAVLSAGYYFKKRKSE